MDFLEKLKFFYRFSSGILLKKKFPLLVGWNLTYRCNLQCKYCGWWENKALELDSKKVGELIKELSYLGTKVISFGGGESCLRKDLGEIIDICKSKKIYVGISSNGILAKEKIKDIQKADIVKFSLDGPAETNDLIRGQGVHDKVIEAVELCKKKRVKVAINSVISKYTNISDIVYLFRVAKKYNIEIYFNPVDSDYSGSSNKDISAHLPNQNYFKKIIKFLIKEKVKGNIFIGNSISGLQYIYNWPNAKKIKCLVSNFFCSISPDGKIFICDNFPHYQKYLISIENNFKDSFYKLKLPYSCNRCWNASMLEFNLLSSFSPRILLDLGKKFRRRL
ncbi:MAG: radical SAM protein [Candidatus Omnitrophica bacterium]|nr:radical SAM protein [Candidatus Omnitrophota bacterium]